MIKSLFAIVASVFVLAACDNPFAEGQKEAAEFKAKCQANPQLQECKDWEQKYGMGG